ncbi:hypothetical protein [Deinococcus multiflagellatus]|uniref:Uncharacterized protein n=1 Tax=Deinococcus multiflagellatus TaxID=1656887 RepID=A0ABW1ZRG5_9DEIO|nr:hypothetical protein [Deinococcus multiflagellatus]MBZ9713599.1 hypothetical protein [Deinococcus multiflagellatus]
MSGAPPARPAGSAVPVGTRAPQQTAGLDLEELTRRVYLLLLEDLRLERARRTGGQ